MTKFLTTIFVFLISSAIAASPKPLTANLGGLKNMLTDNRHFVEAHKSDYTPIAINNPQRPRSTMVTCSDSRVQTTAFDETPINDIFMIRNIGNQLSSNMGDVEYGVRHLKTPLLIVVGHDQCGAVAALSSQKKMVELNADPNIQRSLAALHFHFQKKNKGKYLKGDKLLQANIESNIDYQVEAACLQFKSLVLEGKLYVVGALYDFLNIKKKGFGKLIITNVNGNKDPKFIEEFEKMVLAQELPKP